MQPFMISCPGCGTRFTVRTAGALGQTRQCPKCGAPIEIVDPNAPLAPPRRLQPWNRWALVGGTAAALLVLVALLVFSRGGAAGSSAGQSVAAADASGEDENAEEAAAAEPPENEADPAAEQPVPQPDAEQPDTDALEAELERVLADSAAERARVAAMKSTEDPDQAAGEASAGPRPPAAPSAAERARMAGERSQEVSQPSRESQRSLLGPVSNLPDLAGGDGGGGDAGNAEQSQEGGDPSSAVPEAEKDDAGSSKSEDAASEPAETDDPVYFRMHRKIVLYECDKRPLESLLEELSDLSALDVSLDYAALDRLRIDFETPITLQLEETNLAGILSAIVEPLKLAYVVTGEKILITAPSEKPEEDEGADDSEQAP